MIIVAGALIVDPPARNAYLQECTSVVAAAREAPGCLDFALSPDLVEPGRINVFERWDSRESVEAFGSGPDSAHLAALLDVQVHEYTVLERPR